MRRLTVKVGLTDGPRSALGTPAEQRHLQPRVWDQVVGPLWHTWKWRGPWWHEPATGAAAELTAEPELTAKLKLMAQQQAMTEPRPAAQPQVAPPKPKPAAKKMPAKPKPAA